ncbi:hypothetical protein [Paucibacter soli]
MRWRHPALLLMLMALALLALPAYLERADLQLWLLGPAWCA